MGEKEREKGGHKSGKRRPREERMGWGGGRGYAKDNMERRKRDWGWERECRGKRRGWERIVYGRGRGRREGGGDPRRLLEGGMDDGREGQARWGERMGCRVAGRRNGRRKDRRGGGRKRAWHQWIRIGGGGSKEVLRKGRERYAILKAFSTKNFIGKTAT